MAGTVNAGSIIYEVDMDTARLLSARREVDAALNGISGSMGRLESSVNRTERSVDSMQRTLTGLSAIARGVMAAISIQQVTAYGNEWVTVNNKLANSIRANEDLAQVTQRVFDISQNTMSSLTATATLYGRLERATRSAGTSTKDLVTLTETINKGLAVSGATSEEASSTMTQLSQALASGVLRGEEFNSISENGSRLAVALADSLGVTIGQLRGMAAQGKLTTDVVVNGLLKQSNAIAKEFSNTALTMGQAFTVATNNITKFVGESSSVNTSLNVFNQGVITLSENLGVVANVVAAAALIFGGRFVGALGAATAAQALSTKASIQGAAATRARAKDDMAAAAAMKRKALADESAAKSNLNVAQTELNVLKATNASTEATVAHADAELASIKVNLQQIQAEKALEIQRARSQISEQGRVATATRMAQLRQAETVLTARLARAEATAENTRANAIAAAEAKVSAARMGAAEATGARVAANGALIASQERVAASSLTLSGALKALNAAMMPLGGAIGVIAIVAAGWYLYAQNQAEARKESIAFADTLPDVISKLKEMNLAQAQGVRADTVTSIKNQKDEIADLKSRIADLNKQYNERITLAKQMGGGDEENNGHLRIANELSNDLAKANRDLDSKTRTLANSQDALRLINIQVNQGIVDQMKAARDNAIAVKEAEKNASFLGQTHSYLAGKLGLSTSGLRSFNAESLKINWGGSHGEKLIKEAERRLALSKLEGEARARLQAKYDAQDAGTVDPLAIKQLQDVYAETERVTQGRKDQKKEDKSAAAEGKKLENQSARNARVLEDYRQKAELSADSTSDLSREQAILAAKNKLINPTSEQVATVERDAAAAWDKAAALKAQSSVPELKENADYAKQKQQLELLKSAKDSQGDLLISQQQYNQQSEQLEQDHQTKLAEIRANQAVTPQQDAAAKVDPVQQLANENARKLALIQQFEANKTLTHDQAEALRNATDTQYEQQRIAAQWTIYRNQSVANELLASSIESFSSGASSAITGLINETQSLSEFFANLGTSILNGVVSSLVQMGTQWVMSTLMGQAAQESAIAANQATSIAALAASTSAGIASASALLTAWSPAAMAASVASYGGAATAGLAGYTTAMTAAQTMSIAGARKNGGPVSADSMYRVGEGGKPEIFKASNGSQYMIPGDNGSVISNKDLGSSASGSTAIQQTVQFNIQTTGGIDDATMQKMSTMMKQVSLSTIKDQQRPSGLLSKTR